MSELVKIGNVILVVAASLLSVACGDSHSDKAIDNRVATSTPTTVDIVHAACLAQEKNDCVPRSRVIERKDTGDVWSIDESYEQIRLESLSSGKLLSVSATVPANRYLFDIAVISGSVDTLVAVEHSTDLADGWLVLYHDNNDDGVFSPSERTTVFAFPDENITALGTLDTTIWIAVSGNLVNEVAIRRVLDSDADGLPDSLSGAVFADSALGIPASDMPGHVRHIIPQSATEILISDSQYDPELSGPVPVDLWSLIDTLGVGVADTIADVSRTTDYDIAAPELVVRPRDGDTVLYIAYGGPFERIEILDGSGTLLSVVATSEERYVSAILQTPASVGSAYKLRVESSSQESNVYDVLASGEPDFAWSVNSEIVVAANQTFDIKGVGFSVTDQVRLIQDNNVLACTVSSIVGDLVTIQLPADVSDLTPGKGAMLSVAPTGQIEPADYLSITLAD